MKTQIKNIHELALLKSKDYKKAEYELLKVIENVEKYKVYYAFDCKSLSDYCVSHLGLTYDVAMMFIGVMRKSKRFNSLQTALKENKITMTNARRIAPILTLENQNFWIEEASKTKENLQMKIATHFPERIKKETVKSISEEYVSITIRVKKSDFEKIKRAKELQSKKAKKVVSFEESIVESSKTYLEKNDPIEKAKRITAKQKEKHKSKNSQPLENKQKTPTSLVPIRKSIPPAAIIHAVNLRDKGECQRMDKNGKKCGDRDFTEIHHIIQKSQGGSHHPSNLITYCSGHHKAHHFNN